MTKTFDANDRLALESHYKEKDIHTFTNCVDALLFFAFRSSVHTLTGQH